MKRTVWMMVAVGIVLLGLAACGSAAPESPDESVLFAANGPALTVVEKQPDQYTTDPEDKTVPPEQSPDLLTMNSQEEEGFALFYPLLSETQFRCLMDEDGVDFIPNRLVSCEEGGLAYYSTAAGDLVYCTADFSTVKAVLCQQRVGLIIDARWLDADHLLFLQGNENEQAVYLFRPAEDMVELLYQSPEGRQILGIELDENGQPVCILSPCRSWRSPTRPLLLRKTGRIIPIPVPNPMNPPGRTPLPMRRTGAVACGMMKRTAKNPSWVMPMPGRSRRFPPKK